MKKTFSLILMLGLMLTAASPAFAAENANEKTLSFKNNTAILLDASGSMAKRIDGVSKYNMAKEEIVRFADQIKSKSQVRMTVFGSEGNNKNSGKVQSCESIRSVYGFQRFDRQSFLNSLNGIGPTGWTPIAKALEDAKASFTGLHKLGSKSVFLLTDGEETCGGDPVKTAKELRKQHIKVNVIGFDFKEGFNGQLHEIAKAGGGKYYEAHSQKDMNRIFTMAASSLAE
ncbi:VWA domain-containing protein [Bacillus velezensis]|uniref:VWA domain-containing protein n=1 Tax=Bacillus velezensis TaxID=492670 RepID=UPI001F3441D7|nr:VWA domain-containing protein [Bacillus velezensis]MCG1015476.1 VWA domain-containing protein [Bacillus velezensis]MCR6607011.1 VWA domain-containing protein [Bacillus velezensis]WFP03120.1 VWA domain-containing protein [Bacillus velezensis]